MIIDKALVLNIKDENLHQFGLTALHPMSPKIETSKFFALCKILRSIPRDNDGFKWIKIPNNDYADFMGFNIQQFKQGGYKFHTKYAKKL